MKKLWLWLKKYRTNTQIVNVLSPQWQINQKMIGPIYSLIFMTAIVYFSTSSDRCKLKLAALQRFGCAFVAYCAIVQLEETCKPMTPPCHMVAARNGAIKSAFKFPNLFSDF